MRVTPKCLHTCYTFTMTIQAPLSFVFKLIGTPLLLMHHTHKNTHTITMDYVSLVTKPSITNQPFIKNHNLL